MCILSNRVLFVCIYYATCSITRYHHYWSKITRLITFVIFRAVSLCTLLSKSQCDSIQQTNYTHTCKGEHHYYVLENNRAPHDHGVEVILPDSDAPALPPPYKPDPVPVYHDIRELPIRGATASRNQYTNCTISSAQTVTEIWESSLKSNNHVSHGSLCTLANIP